MNTVFCCLLSVATPVVTPDNIRQMLISRTHKIWAFDCNLLLTMLTGEIFITSSRNITAHPSLPDHAKQPPVRTPAADY